MKTEKEILDMMKVLKTRQEFFEHQELQEGKSEHIYPDPIDESANKILALQWVLGVIDDLFTYPNTRTKYNQELQCLNILKDIKAKEKHKAEIRNILNGKQED